MSHNRYDHRFHSHYQSNQETQGSSQREQDKEINHLSPITGKSGKGNKENINIFDQVNTLLKHYQQNPLKKKCSLPTSDNRVLSDVCTQIRSKLHNNQKQNVKGPSASISPYSKAGMSNVKQPKTSYHNEALKIASLCQSGFSSPQNKKTEMINYYRKYIQKPDAQTPQRKRCSYHRNKKAKFYDFDSKKIPTFYCSNCSINKLVSGHKVFLIEDYNLQPSKHRNILSDSGLTGRKEMQQVSSTSRINFWSVDENSLMSSTPLLLESLQNANTQSCDQNQQKTFESSVGDLELEEQQTKEKELESFMQEIESLQQQSNNLLNPVNTQNHAQRLIQVTQDLENTVRYVKQQNLKIIQNIHNQSINQPICKEQKNQAQDIIMDLQNIHSDIYCNRDNIINQMQLKPFRIILSKYREKMNIHEASLNRHFSTQNQIKNQLVQVNTVVLKLENLRSLMQQQLGLKLDEIVESPPTLENSEDELMSTSRNLTRKIAVRPFQGENVYISFENKELFMAAQRASMPHSQPGKETQNLKSQQLDTDIVQHDSLDMKNSDKKGRKSFLESPNFLRG